ncbi:hypothetical protein P40081_15200 [Paenibacillus sp. FSL P4-0081]|uniref:hypothetical protein n=1 Tax=Paenibacillus sp. FSL P4-0081 TaxID=1536769 RepID=UPI0004F6282C|nr:hypothetical protein [Paenibacillus sp. FSL P4-0081]AIQ29346.1 hypothetical protein P40081_15200 [Paenibacillus sp. FSL P4-0081]
MPTPILPPLKPIPNYPGYSVSRDGVVYSSRNSRDGTPKLIKVNSRGKVNLNGLGWQKVRDPMEVAREVWKIKDEPAEIKVKKPKYRRIRVAALIMEEKEGISTKLIIGGKIYVLQT